MKKFFAKILLTFLVFFSGFSVLFAQTSIPSEYILPNPEGSINISGITKWNTWPDWSTVYSTEQDWLIKILEFIESFLLKVALPVVAVGTSFYIAYELFTAEWDSSKMQRAWKAVVYSIVAIVSILLSSLVINLISNINLG